MPQINKYLWTVYLRSKQKKGERINFIQFRDFDTIYGKPALLWNISEDRLRKDTWPYLDAYTSELKKFWKYASNK